MIPNPESLEPRAHIRVVPGTHRAWKAVKGMGFEATCVTLPFLSPSLRDPAADVMYVVSVCLSVVVNVESLCVRVLDVK